MKSLVYSHQIYPNRSLCTKITSPVSQVRSAWNNHFILHKKTPLVSGG